MNSLDKPTRTLDARPLEGALPIAGGPAREAGPADGPLLLADRPAGADGLGRSAMAALLAELVLHRRLETPFCVGLFAGPGAGKTFFLNQIVGAAEGLGAAAAADTPLLGATIVRVDAGRPGVPGELLAGAVLDRLAHTHPALAADLAHAGVDPAAAAREAHETLDEARRRLAAGRATLDDLAGREARLADTAVEAQGTMLDAYARQNRAGIERALRAFGFEGPDPVGLYKGLVRDAGAAGTPAGRAALVFRAIWAYPDQTRLLLTALACLVLAWAAGAALGDQEGWVAWLRGLGAGAAGPADWAQTHAGWLSSLRTLLILGCMVGLAVNGLRAARFLRPLFAGQGLLRRDLSERGAELRTSLAHQTQRVDALAAAADEAAQRAAEADRRVGHRGSATALRWPSPRSAAPDWAAAVFTALAARMAQPPGGQPVPRRLVLAVDDLDARPAAEAAAFLQATEALLGPGVACLVAADRAHLLDGLADADPAEAQARLDRCVQLGVRVDADAADRTPWRDFAAALTRPAPASRERAPAPDLKETALDRPWRPREAETVAALASFAGDTPRAVKRYLNLYRVARADPLLRDAPAPVFTGLALALALGGHGYAEELAGLEKVSHGEAPDGTAQTLRQAIALAREVSGEPVELAQAQRALAVAARYGSPGRGEAGIRSQATVAGPPARRGPPRRPSAREDQPPVRSEVQPL